LAPKYRLLRKSWFYYKFRSIIILTTKTIFSAKKLVNTKVLENLVRFPESRRMQIFKYVLDRYDQNTKLERDKLEQDDKT
jgi:hypothetical protein